MNEMKCVVSLYEFKNKTGNYEIFKEELLHTDVNTSVKELFDRIISDEEIENKFYVMHVKYTMEKPFSDYNQFYKIRTDLKGKIFDISLIGPNSIDKNILIDAIIGCTPPEDFKDKVVSKCICIQNNKPTWTEDTKERLSKVNDIRLKEIYEKLKS